LGRFTSTVLPPSKPSNRKTGYPGFKVIERGDELLNVKEIAAALKVCTATVYKIVDRGELPHMRVLNSVRVRRADLAAYMKQTSRGKKG
jgi:excisionase family DNA binding protein